MTNKISYLNMNVMDALKLICSWPGAIIIIGILIFIAFMTRPKFFENIKLRFKRKDVEGEIESKPETHIESEEKAEAEIVVSSPEKKSDFEGKEEIEKEFEEDKRSTLDKASDAYKKRDIEEFTKYWDMVIEELDEPLKSKYLALKFYNRYRLGDDNAIDELEKLIDKEDELGKFAREYLALIFKNFDKTQEAIDLINKNIEIAKDSKDKLLYSLKLCDLKIEIKKYEEAEEILKKLQEGFNDSLPVSKIMQKWSALYEAMGKLEISLQYSEKALELNPTNDSLRFNIAYKYSEIDQDEMAVFHYKMLDSHNYSPESVKNNLGVAYGNLEMPIKGVKYYKDAIKEGSTLASSNIGNKYINEGLIDQGKKMLKKALEDENVHPNVNEALASIDEKISQEKKLEDKLLKLAKIKKEFFLKACDSFTYKAQISDEKLVGTWSSTLSDISFIKEEKIKGQFKYLFHDVRLIEEELNNSVFKFKWKIEKLYITEQGTGILIFSEDGNKFEGLLIDLPSKNDFVTFSGNRK